MEEQYDDEDENEDGDEAEVATEEGPSKRPQGKMPIALVPGLDSEWAHSGSMYVPSTRSDKVEVLPGGIYHFGMDQNGRWWMDRAATHFEFPFKVYHSCDEIINRIVRYWKVNQGNLGVLMNGLRGAGKTMAAQLLANELIRERNLPVLIVKNPVPLQVIFDAVKQDLMVIFDEFEKTHNEQNQQQLLSVIDGTSRTKHGRLVVFTTNKTAIDENFKDRPSRIHYQFEFQRVADEVIEGLMADSLPEDLHHLKGDIRDFLSSRQICTIDIVKAVIAEVKTFREAPAQFETLLNVSKGEPPSYTVTIIDEKTGGTLQTACYYFKPDGRGAQLFAGNKRAIKEFIDNQNTVNVGSRSNFDGTYYVNLLEKCEEEGCWLAELCVPTSKTHFSKFHHINDHYNFWLDNRPEDWEFPFTPESVDKSEKQMKELNALLNKCAHAGTLYGTGKHATFKIRIDANKDYNPSRYKVTGKGGYDFADD